MSSRPDNDIIVKDLEYYSGLPWTYAVEYRKDKEEFRACIRELPEIAGVGRNEMEALGNLQDLFGCEIAERLRNNDPIPEPPPKHWRALDWNVSLSFVALAEDHQALVVKRLREIADTIERVPKAVMADMVERGACGGLVGEPYVGLDVTSGWKGCWSFKTSAE
jgi:predicted RNase H-like HicB family nuclease